MPMPATPAILRAFQTHEAVLLGEMHWSVAEHRFLDRLLRDPRLPDVLDDIAVEFANARYQPLIDRYISGEPVPPDSLRQIWQNAIVPLAWDASVYPQFFRVVREINRGRPPNRQLRVLAMDPPIPWDSIHQTEQIPRRWGYRDPSWVDVLEREVFAKHRKALVICGGVHVLRRDPTTSFEPAKLESAGLGDALEQLHPGATYAIYPAAGTEGLASLVHQWPANSIADVQGTSLGAHNSHILLPGSVTVFRMVDGKRVPKTLTDADFPPIERVVDAIIYFGRHPTLAPRLLDSYRDSAYVAELHRRSSILEPIFGQQLDPLIDSVARVARVACQKAPRCAAPSHRLP